MGGYYSNVKCLFFKKCNVFVRNWISYYDQLILNHISFVAVRIAHIIGEIIGEEQLGIKDIFIAIRIKVLIRQGLLKQEGNDVNFYRNNIRKV